jgi:signal transduction histidine kinase
MRIGRREAKRRLTGLTLPTVLGTGGGGASWTIEAGDKSHARSVLQYLEDRRVLYDPIEVELPLHCWKSVQEMRGRLASFIADSQSSELRNPLRAIQAACRQFLTDAPPIEGALQHNDLIRQWTFNQAVGEFRDVDVDEELAKIMPPQVDKDY